MNKYGYDFKTVLATYTPPAMAISLSYFLDRKGADIDTPATIRCQLRYTLSTLSWAADKRCGRTPIRHTFATADKCPPKAWKDSACTKAHPNAATINRRLAEITERAERLHEQFVRSGHFPSPQQFAIQIIQGEHFDVSQNDFWSRYDQYIEFLQNSGSSKTFIQNQSAAHRIFRKFEIATKTPLDFGEIGRTVAAKFSKWLSVQPRNYNRPGQDIEKTASYHIRALKHFLNHALAEGWTNSLSHKQIKLSFRRKEAFPITLTQEEVNRISALTTEQIATHAPGSNKIRIQNIATTRDWFIFATQTGIRYGNWNADEITVVNAPEGGKNIRFSQVKTINSLEIPLSTLALSILERNGGALPPKMSGTTTIQHLNILCQAAGIDKQITTHTARRTFCTLQEKMGVPRQVIMRISGHLTEREYLKYLGVSFEYNASMMRRANPEMFAKAAG